jgi:mono/diheme cytochrome c family protein
MIAPALKVALKVLLGSFALVALLVVPLVIWVQARWVPTYPETPTPSITASDDPEIVAQGEYIFHTAGHCTACHMDKQEYNALELGGRGMPGGNRVWSIGPLGKLRSPNLTSDVETGIGALSDAELARALRYAVLPNDEPAVMMRAAGPMADEDLVAVISYLRTIEPVRNPVGERRELNFLGKLLLLTELRFLTTPRPPSQGAPPYVPQSSPGPARGEYLARGPAACVLCHTGFDLKTGEFVEPLFSGSIPEPDETDPSMLITAPNITRGGRLAGWSQEQFINRMRAGSAYAGTSMPWRNYAGMTDNDLASIYQYLMSVEPSDIDRGPSRRPVK